MSDIYLQGDQRWDDLRQPASGINPPGAAADPTLNTTNGLWEFSASATNTLALQVQMPHHWRTGSIIRPHVHWRKKTAGAGNVYWRLTYEFAALGDVYTDSQTTLNATTTVSVANDDGTALRHLITSFGDIDMTGMGISCMGLMTLSRIGGDGADTYAGVAQLLEFDIHYQIDSLGSYIEYQKQGTYGPGI